MASWLHESAAVGRRLAAGLVACAGVAEAPLPGVVVGGDAPKGGVFSVPLEEVPPTLI